jgi:hypothetical protein
MSNDNADAATYIQLQAERQQPSTYHRYPTAYLISIQKRTTQHSARPNRNTNVSAPPTSQVVKNAPPSIRHARTSTPASPLSKTNVGSTTIRPERYQQRPSHATHSPRGTPTSVPDTPPSTPFTQRDTTSMPHPRVTAAQARHLAIDRAVTPSSTRQSHQTPTFDKASQQQSLRAIRQPTTNAQLAARASSLHHL